MVEQRHPNCTNPECKVCLADVELLATALEERFGDIEINDILGEYRHFLDEHDVPAETDHGWFTEEAFDERNLNSFAAGCPSSHWPDNPLKRVRDFYRVWSSLYAGQVAAACVDGECVSLQGDDLAKLITAVG